MAQWAKCLPHKNEGLGLNPPAPMKKILHAVQVCIIPTLGRERKEGPWACCLASLAIPVSFRFSERLKIKMERN